MSVAETALSDFFARVLINKTGRINLQDWVKSSAAAEGALPANVAKNQRDTINIANYISRTWEKGINDVSNAPAPVTAAPVAAPGVSFVSALLLAIIAVTEDAMRELALQRGVAVKEYLAEKQLPPGRLFLGAAKPSTVDAK